MTRPPPTRILLADDHALVRRGVRLILDSEPDLTVVTEAGDGAEALALARVHAVDLAVLDVAMPRLTGLQATRELSRRSPGTRILLLSMSGPSSATGRTSSPSWRCGTAPGSPGTRSAPA